MTAAASASSATASRSPTVVAATVATADVTADTTADTTADVTASPPAVFVLLDDATAAPGNAVSRLYTDLAREDIVPPGTAPAALDGLLAHGWREGWHATLFAPYEFGGEIVGAPVHVGDALPFHDGALRMLWFRMMRKLDAAAVAAWLSSQAAQAAQAEQAEQAEQAQQAQQAQQAAAQSPASKSSPPSLPARSQPVSGSATPVSSPAGVMDVTADTTPHRYADAIARIHAWIEAGDTYQVNFTQRLRFAAFGDPIALYAALRAAQPVPYGVLACLPGDGWVLSLSPELFVAHDGARRLLTRPMKGTAPRSGDPAADARAAARLAADPKNRAENVMIVDLLRNDLGRIAVPGSVAVPERFVVQPFGKVLQMTSTVTATARPGTGFGELFGALFPCGSITGAPKRRTMQLIAELESSPRGLYTGAIGWLDAPAEPAAPMVPVTSAASAGNARPGAFGMSVAIRTLVLGPSADDGTRPGEMGVGGGIVHDSVADEEYAECGWKARFLTTHDPGFTLFETMHARDGACAYRERHLARLARSAATFGFALDLPAARAALQAEAARLGDGDWRLRMSVDKAGTLRFASGALAALAAPGDNPAGSPVARPFIWLELATAPLPDHDPLRRHKTSARAVFDAGWQAAERAGAFDCLFFNTRDELLEGGRSSVFAKVDGRWLTPPLAADILPGVMRAVVLEEGDALLDGPAREGIVTRDMLRRAEAIVVVNALRGAMRARLR